MIRRDLSDCTTHCYRSDHEWAREVMRARDKADQKHGENSIEQIPADSPAWLPILVEEVGELAHELTYDAGESGINGRRRAELIDVLAVASAWLAAQDEEPAPCESDRPDPALTGGGDAAGRSEANVEAAARVILQATADELGVAQALADAGWLADRQEEADVAAENERLLADTNDLATQRDILRKRNALLRKDRAAAEQDAERLRAKVTELVRERDGWRRNLLDLSKVSNEKYAEQKTRADKAEAERDEAVAGRARAIAQCRFLHQGALSRLDWHVKHCGAMQAVQRVQALADQWDRDWEASDKSSNPGFGFASRKGAARMIRKALRGQP